MTLAVPTPLVVWAAWAASTWLIGSQRTSQAELQALLPFGSSAVAGTRCAGRPVVVGPCSRHSVAEDAATQVEAARARVPLYVFSGADERAAALARFERIDDVIMGGVSRSNLVEGDGYAAWKGLVRTDGGGFCGQRTRPFERPLDLSGADGVYVTCRLASDSDAERRVWKLSLRTVDGRGEVVYQAQYVPPVANFDTVYVPFSAFRLVRGPVAVPDAPRLASVGGVYQLGFTVSKFVISESMTPLPNFRNGTFQLDILELGAYANVGQGAFGSNLKASSAPRALADSEARRRQPRLERVLQPVFRALFSEEQRRRQRATELLRRRGASQLDLVKMGWRFKRLRGQSVLGSLLQSAGQLSSAVFGGALLLGCRVLIFPLVRWRLRRRRRAEMQELQKQGGAI